MSVSEAKDTTEQAEFRAYCRQWLADNHPGQPPRPLPQSPLELSDPESLAWLQQWQKKAWEAGLIGCDYPVECGGGGRNNCQSIANQELHAAKTPYFPNLMGLGMAAPTIFFHAREEVKQELLPPLFSGEQIWCQGFSEPGAGSDLAGQQTFAERKGDKWIINGHKVWTTSAHFASWMILLCRTSKEHKYEGLSYFVVPIKAMLGKGCTVRPLIKMTGETGFNEVLFEDYEVDDRYRLDEVGAGWKVAMTTLSHERGAGPLTTPRAGGMATGDGDTVDVYKVESMIDLVRRSSVDGAPAVDDASIRDELMQLVIRQRGLVENQRRAAVPALIDHPARLPLQSKLLSTEFSQDMAELCYQVQGANSTLAPADNAAMDGGQWPQAYMNSFGVTIAAGTSEVQRNILGERVLDLPKSK